MECDILRERAGVHEEAEELAARRELLHDHHHAAHLLLGVLALAVPAVAADARRRPLAERARALVAKRAWSRATEKTTREGERGFEGTTEEPIHKCDEMLFVPTNNLHTRRIP